MNDLNRQSLEGNLAKDAVVRATQTGKTVTCFRVLTNHQVGEQTFTQGHNIVVWGKRGVALEAAGYLKKGSRVFVEGRTEHKSWEDDEGLTRYFTEIVLERFAPIARPAKKSQKSQEEVSPPSDDDYAG